MGNWKLKDIPQPEYQFHSKNEVFSIVFYSRLIVLEKLRITKLVRKCVPVPGTIHVWYWVAKRLSSASVEKGRSMSNYPRTCSVSSRLPIKQNSSCLSILILAVSTSRIVGQYHISFGIDSCRDLCKLK